MGSVQWKQIKDSRYSVSSDGQVRNDNTSRVLKQSDSNGYRIVTIGKKTQYVHRLVAEAFISNYSDLPCVNHRNGIKSDNTVQNLEWTSYRGNTRHAMEELGMREALMKPRRGRTKRGVYHYPNGNKNYRAIIHKDNVAHLLGYFTSEREAELAYFNCYFEFYGEVPKEYLAEDIARFQANPLIKTADIVNTRKKIKKDFSHYPQNKQDLLFAACLQGLIKVRSAR